MSKSYVPQLKAMREMAIRQGHPEDAFNAKFIKSLELVMSFRRTANGVEESFDAILYFAEKMTWQHLRFLGPFPGVDPTASIYNSSLALLRYGATYDKMTAPQFNKAFVDCMIGAHDDFEGLGMDVAQYEAEKRFWDLRWRKAEPFDAVVKRCYSSLYRNQDNGVSYAVNLKIEAKSVVKRAKSLMKKDKKIEAPPAPMEFVAGNPYSSGSSMSDKESVTPKEVIAAYRYSARLPKPRRKSVGPVAEAEGHCHPAKNAARTDGDCHSARVLKDGRRIVAPCQGPVSFMKEKKIEPPVECAARDYHSEASFKKIPRAPSRYVRMEQLEALLSEAGQGPYIPDRVRNRS